MPGSVMPGPIRIIAGSGRSGTTWVQDVLADANALRPVFEPLHPLAVPEASSFAYRYFRPAAEQAAAEAFLTRVFEGDLESWWTDYRVRPDRLRPAASLLRSATALNEYFRRWRKLYRRYRRYAPTRRRSQLLVKCIRANLMLGWIRAHFPARIAFVLRHPGAVVESRLRLGGDDWEPEQQLQRYRAQSDLQEDYLFQYNDVLRGPLSAAEAHTAIWCIENQLPLKQLGATEVTVAHYEHLLSGQPAPWRSLVDGLQLSHLPDPGQLMTPSQTAGQLRGPPFDAADGARWRDRLDAPAVREIATVLRAMDVTIYDIDDPMPRSSASNDTHQHSATDSPR